MGGIPYQSPGCKACRKRKVRCDLGKPECMRCLKRKTPCPGYDKDRIFVHNQTTSQGEGNGSHVRYLGRARQLILPLAVSSGPVVRSQVVSTFLDASFPADIGFSDAVDALPNLVVNITMRPSKSEMLERALVAASCMYLGRIKQDDALVCTGVQHYDIAIRHMSGMLYRKAHTDDMIYTTVIFQLLQSLYCPYGLRAWLAHTAGTNALLRHCYQYASTDTLVDVIYHKLQKLMVIHSTIVIKWPESEYTYLRQNTIGTPLDGLFDIFAVLASLLAATEQINHADLEACQALLQNCYSHRQSILRWYSQNQGFICGPPMFCDPSENLCPRLPPTDDLFGVSYRFTSLDHARLHIFYWTSLAMIQCLIYQSKILVLAHYYASGLFPVDPATHEEYILSAHYTDEICRAIPFCLQPKTKLAGARIVIPAIPHICRPYTHLRDQDKFLWCESVSSVLVEIGFHMAVPLRQTARKYWSLSADPHMNSMLSLSARWEISDDEQAPPVTNYGKRAEMPLATSASRCQQFETEYSDN
ncbi:hypothetical protein N7532_001177 [Penicillium argentinense]|uniref:Zn(2)-C6 fungal-type domain-containing protein n=1 Tax=Penicillium argentinense TaxID=1131581 RepID=A0A9W9KM92_9EURO|nr:uncharacterized protein N7532_001177 [Penicillium argentinense]KAJ5110642.1 hypothetical protein N7532_001177 [Penicillium argentinense]